MLTWNVEQYNNFANSDYLYIDFENDEHLTNGLNLVFDRGEHQLRILTRIVENRRSRIVFSKYFWNPWEYNEHVRE